jgi:hypothetical protein
VHVQGAPANPWIINHPLLSDYPSVTVIDSAETEVEVKVVYVSSTQVRIEADSGPFSGKASLR